MVQLDKLVIAVIVFFVMIVGGVLYVHDLESSYSNENLDMELDQYVNNTFTDATNNDISDSGSAVMGDDSYELSKDMQGRMFDKEVDDTDTESSMFAGSFSVIRLVTTPVNLIRGVMGDVSKNLGVPPVFVQYGFAAIIILVIFAVIFLIFRVRS